MTILYYNHHQIGARLSSGIASTYDSLELIVSRVRPVFIGWTSDATDPAILSTYFSRFQHWRWKIITEGVRLGHGPQSRGHACSTSVPPQAMHGNPLPAPSPTRNLLTASKQYNNYNICNINKYEPNPLLLYSNCHSH